MCAYETIKKLSTHSDMIIAIFISICHSNELGIFRFIRPIIANKCYMWGPPPDILDERYIKVAIIWNDGLRKYCEAHIITPELYYIWLNIFEHRLFNVLNIIKFKNMM